MYVWYKEKSDNVMTKLKTTTAHNTVKDVLSQLPQRLSRRWRQLCAKLLNFKARWNEGKVEVKHGFHSSWPKLTARELGCIFWHPSWWVSKNAPEFTSLQLWWIFWHPSTRAVNSGVKKCTRVHGPWTRVVETGLNSNGYWLTADCLLLSRYR